MSSTPSSPAALPVYTQKEKLVSRLPLIKVSATGNLLTLCEIWQAASLTPALEAQAQAWHTEGAEGVAPRLESE